MNDWCLMNKYNKSEIFYANTWPVEDGPFEVIYESSHLMQMKTIQQSR